MNRNVLIATVVSILSRAALAQAPAPSAVPAPVAERADFQMGLTTLDAMHKKGALSDAEYDAALKDLADIGSRAVSASTLVTGKFATTFYGFVEGDFIHDTTQSFNELAGMSPIVKPSTNGGGNAGDNGRTMFAIRNSRLGFRLKAPEVNGIRASAQLEMDFFGNQPGSPPVAGASAPSGALSATLAESSFFNNPTFRVRHFLLKLDNDFVNVWIGQTWELAGWQGQFQPSTVAIQGLPGQLYSRTAQLRLDKVFHLGPTTVEIAAAALRPPQMNAEIPDFQGGIKLAIDGWTGVQTASATGGTSINPATIGLSGGVRSFRLAQSLTTSDYARVTGHVVALDLMIPVIPAKERGEWALTFVGEATTGTGDAEMFTNLKGGAGVGAPNGVTSAQYTAAKLNDIDTGLAGWINTDGSIGTVNWKTLLLSAQLYLPPSGKLWLSGSFSNTLSDNVTFFGAAPAVWWHETWWDLNVFADVTPAVRLGLEYSHFQQTYGDGVSAANDRVQFSGFFIF